MSQLQRPDEDDKPTGAGEWKLLPLLMVPLACCGLPLIVASLATVSALGWGVGLSGAAAVAAIAAIAALAVNVRTRAPRNETRTKPS